MNDCGSFLHCSICTIVCPPGLLRFCFPVQIRFCLVRSFFTRLNELNNCVTWNCCFWVALRSCYCICCLNLARFLSCCCCCTSTCSSLIISIYDFLNSQSCKVLVELPDHFLSELLLSLGLCLSYLMWKRRLRPLLLQLSLYVRSCECSLPWCPGSHSLSQSWCRKRRFLLKRHQ